jgi:hypothetical protein
MIETSGFIYSLITKHTSLHSRGGGVSIMQGMKPLLDIEFITF